MVFREKASEVQRELVESLTSEVLYIIRKALVRPFKETDLVALPTGDGIALAYLHSDTKRWTAESVIELTFRLHHWSFNFTDSGETIKLRIGVHVGAVDFLVDINNNTNICGDSINISQRIMDACSPSQTLLSEQAQRHYFGSDRRTMKIVVNHSSHEVVCDDAIEVYVKHNVRLPVYRLRLETETEWFECSEPFSKHIMLLTTTPLPKEIVGDFSKALEKSREVALIQLTGARLLEKLIAGKLTFDKEIEKLWILMPDEESFGQAYYDSLRGNDDITHRIAKWKNYLREFLKENNQADIRLITFNAPAFLGASFLNWNNHGGKIHVSPYIWGEEAVKCPGFDIQWSSGGMPEIFMSYVNGLKYLCKNGKRIAL